MSRIVAVYLNLILCFQLAQITFFFLLNFVEIKNQFPVNRIVLV